MVTAKLDTSISVRRATLGLLGAMLLCLFTAVNAQAFNADNYYQQCLRFEASGNLITAKQSCLNALAVKPDFSDAELALARIEIGLGQLGAAAARLPGLTEDVESAEPYLLQAEIAMQQRRFDEAGNFLAQATARLAEHFNSRLEGQRLYLLGRLAEARGDFSAAQAHYGAATNADSLNLNYRLARASLLFELGEPAEARAELERYQSFSGNVDDPRLLSLLGRAKWALGDLSGAARDLENAIISDMPRVKGAEERDRRNLALVYYGLGDMQSGWLTLQTALTRGDLPSFLLSHSLPWLLLLVLLLLLHLLGESRVEAVSGLEVIEGPENWTVGNVYAIFIAGLIAAGLTALIYGAVAYGNLLAVLTPVQSTEVRALALAVLSLVLLLATLARVRRNGWPPLDTLLGRSDGATAGIVLGLLSLAAVLGLLAYGPDWPWLSGFYLDFGRLSPLLIAAATLLPLTELYFRAFAIAPLSRRYNPALGVMISSVLFALMLGTPIVLLIGLGFAAGELLRRSRSGLAPLMTMLVLNLGLMLGVAYSGWVRSLFL